MSRFAPELAGAFAGGFLVTFITIALLLYLESR